MNDNLAQARGATAFPHTNRICDTNARSRNLRLRSPHLRSGMMERSPLCNVDQSNAGGKKESPGLWLFMSVLLVELTSVARSTVRSGRQFWTGAFDLESACQPRENWPPR